MYGRLYPNLDDLVDVGLLDKGEQDLRSNYYKITNDGQRLVEDTIRYFESIRATNPAAADGGREQTAVDVEELEVRVDALSKGLAAARESDEAERQERRRLQEENDERVVDLANEMGHDILGVSADLDADELVIEVSL